MRPRNVRAELKLDPEARLAADFLSPDGTVRALVEQNRDLILRLAALLELRIADGRFDSTAGSVRSTSQFDLRIAGDEAVNVEADLTRLRKEKDRLAKDLESKQNRLADQTFRERAPAEIVQQMEATLATRRAEFDKVVERLGQLERRRFSRRISDQRHNSHASRDASMAPRNIPGSTDRRIDALLTLLSENPMIVISGQKIAREIGVSRSAVWRWTQRLRALGVRVKGHPRTGYQLERMPDVLLPSHLRRQLIDTPFGKHIHHYFKAGSTNGIAFDMGQAGEPHGTVVLAEEQTGGRGRAGRSWHSEKSSGIYATVLLRPQASPVLAPVITMLAGLAARDAVLEELELAPDLRWPNDLLLGGKKFCGILTEMHAEPDRIHFVIVGMGINVNHAGMPPELARIATSLRMATGKTHSRLTAAGAVAAQPGDLLQSIPGGRAGADRRALQRSVELRAREARAHHDGKEIYTGTTDGLEPGGLLRVRRADGRRNRHFRAT